MNRNQGVRPVPPARSPQTGAQWARLVTPGRLSVGPWSQLKPADAVRHPDLGSDVDAEVITPASTGVSLWEGFVPDPVDPIEPGLDGFSLT